MGEQEKQGTKTEERHGVAPKKVDDLIPFSYFSPKRGNEQTVHTVVTNFTNQQFEDPTYTVEIADRF